MFFIIVAPEIVQEEAELAIPENDIVAEGPPFPPFPPGQEMIDPKLAVDAVVPVLFPAEAPAAPAGAVIVTPENDEVTRASA